MGTKNMKTRLPLALLAVLPMASHAQTTITQTQSFGTDVLSFTDILTFNQFNGNVADLIGIEICYSLTVDGGQMVIDNDSNTAATVNAMFGAQLDVTSTDVGLVNGSFAPIFNSVTSTTNQTFNLAANVGDGIGDYDSTGPDGDSLAGALTTSTGGDTVFNGAWSGYLGAGTFDLCVAADALATVGAVGGVEFATTPAQGSGTISVKYHLAPEPSTALLGLIGLVGLVGRRSR